MMADGLGIAAWIFRKVFPVSGLESVPPEEVAALQKAYLKWELLAVPFVLGYSAACGLGWFVLLQQLAGVVDRFRGPSLYTIRPDQEFWGLPALFLGIISAAVPMHLTCKALLGDRYDDYIRWTNLRHCFDGWTAFRVFAVVVVVGATLVVAAALSSWVEFRDDRVIIKRPWAWDEGSYPYGRVVAVARIARARATSGRTGPGPYHAIRFDDGETWATRSFFTQPDPQRDEAIAALVSERSGRQIQRLDLIDDLKP